MKSMTTAVGLVLALIATPVIAKPTEAQMAAAKVAEARGAQMYAYDQAAWHASDAFQADLKRARIDDDAMSAAGLRGYVVEPGGDSLLLATFYAEKGGRTSAYARYWVAGNAVARGGLVPSGEDNSISPLGLKLIAARGWLLKAARDDRVGLCSNSSPNTIVLPPDESGKISTYILTSTVDAGSYPAGGHFRFDFNEEGRLVAKRPFMKSCFPLNYRARDGNSIAALFLSHLLDPQPTEIHVFVSYSIPVSLGIITTENKAIWEVNKGRISYSSDVGKD